MKRISSYNIKWLTIYLIYVLCVVAALGEDIFYEWDTYLIVLIIIPLILYLFFPLLLKVIGKWKLVKFFDRIIDVIYQGVREHL